MRYEVKATFAEITFTEYFLKAVIFRILSFSDTGKS